MYFFLYADLKNHIYNESTFNSHFIAYNWLIILYYGKHLLT